MISTKEFEHAVKMYSPHLLRYARRVIGAASEPADVIQDCFEAVWKNRKTLNRESIRFFLFRIAHRRMVDEYRLSLRRANLPDHWSDQLNVNPHRANDHKDLVEKGMALLTPEARELLVLRDLEGYSYDEIGKICDLSEAQVKVYLFRARKRLKEVIIGLESV